MLRLLFLCCAISPALLWPSEARSFQESETDVYPFLKRLELDRFQIAFLEHELDLNSKSPQTRRWAHELASLLVQQLIAAETPEAVVLADSRLKLLLESHSELQTPSLHAAFAYADFLRVERLCESAFDGPDDDAVKLAQSNLQVLADRLEKLRGEWSTQTKQAAQYPSEPEIELDEAQQNELQKREGLLKQVQFLLAWLRFYDGVLATSNDRRVALWRESNGEFRAILQIPPNHNVTEIQFDWFELSGSTLARVVLGLAITEQAIGNAKEAEYCFSLLSEAPVPRSIRESVSSWRLRAFVYAEQWSLASEWLRSVRLSKGANAPSAAALALAAEGIVSRRALTKISSDQSALLCEIIIQLVDANELGMVDQLLNSEPDLEQGIAEPFYRNWLAARRSFQRAETSHRPGDYAEAIANAGAALQFHAESTSLKRTADIHSIIAWSLWRTGRATEAAREFRRLAYLTRSLDSEASARAAWNGIQALIESPTAKSLLQHEIFAAIEEFARMHPHSPLLSRAQLERLQLEAQWQTNPQAIEQLLAIPVDDARFADAQWSICRVHHVRLLDALSVSDLAAEGHFSALQQAADKSIAEVLPIADSTRAQMILLAADAALRIQPPRLELAETRLDRAREIVERLGPSDSGFASFQSIRFRWAIMSENEELAAELATWLAEKAPTWQQRSAGMMYLAEKLDDELTALPANDELRERGFLLYRGLTQGFGDTLADLQRSQNAFVAMTRLAEIEAATNRIRDADQHFNMLRAAEPDDLGSLQKSARCKIQLADYSEALDLWRRIAHGAVDRDDWLEAKYHIVVCLSQTSPKIAGEVLEQTLSLAADLPDAWRVRFDQLRAELKPERRP